MDLYFRQVISQDKNDLWIETKIQFRKKKENMEFAILVLTLILFDLAAWRWGVDSRNSRDGSDWVLRQPAHRA